MHFNPASLRHSGAPKPANSWRRNSSQATAEIHAFIATRDLALAEAERHVSNSTLNRAFLANELVQSCLAPARSPYDAQSLADSEAHAERKRCDAVSRRLAQLRVCSVAAA